MNLVILILTLLFQFDISETPIITPCSETEAKAKLAREERDLTKEILIWESAISSGCELGSEAYSQLSLCYLEAGDQSYSKRGKKDKSARKDLFNKALGAANIAIRIDSTNKYGFEHKAMAFAGILDVEGLRQKAQLADSVRINAEIALRLDPNNDRALHILGRWHYEVANLKGVVRFFSRLLYGTAPKGSFEKARDYFNKAVQLDDYPVHNYWLATTFLKLKDEDKARHHFEHLLTLGNQHHNDEFFKKKALEELKKL